MSYIQIALLLLKIINYIIRKVEQSKWEAEGYRKAVADELAAISVSVGVAKEAFEEASKATPEDRRRSLKDPI
jgi:protein-disulfide isomerase-like protein with CxxC motif